MITKTFMLKCLETKRITPREKIEILNRYCVRLHSTFEIALKNEEENKTTS